jgi:hypothetical protein
VHGSSSLRGRGPGRKRYRCDEQRQNLLQHCDFSS